MAVNVKCRRDGMGKEDILIKGSKQKEKVDKNGFIMQKTKKEKTNVSINLDKENPKEAQKETLEENIKLTNEEKKLAKEIKSTLRKTAQTIVEIGEELSTTVKDKQRGFKELFYAEIGISDRSAQRYMQIANNVKVIELKEKNLLEGKTMTDLLQLISPDTSIKENNIDTKKVANGFYSRYKETPDTLREIIKELQDLLEDK